MSLLEICNYLKSEGFHFLESWVAECINYYKSNNPTISTKDLREEVRQQWLLLNLRDIKVGAFPPDLKSQAKVILPGKYAVQVETLIDSGQSRYSQWQTIRKTDCDNVNVAAKPKENESVARRCFTMKITDGVQDLSAMEYEVIPALKLNNPDQPPGFKMLIKGPVTCRKGMIMLKPENVIICGGEVDTFAQHYSLQAVLANALNLEFDAEVDNSLTNGNIVPPVDDTFLADMDEEMFETTASVPAIPSGTAGLDSRSRSINTNHPSFEPTVVTIDSDPFGEEDDMLFNIPEVDSVCASPQPIPPTSSTTHGVTASKSREENVVRKQTSISQFFSKGDSVSSGPKKTGIAVPQTSTSAPRYVSSTPFVYLLQIVNATLKSDTDFKVKAVIITLKSKIARVNDMFTLKAKICDGSLSLDVAFSTEVLESFLGFTPYEMTVMLKQKDGNPDIGDRLKTAFASLQSKLISLNAIFCIRFFLDKSIPLVLSLEELTARHLNDLRARQ